ncbi:hypothetical protein J6590_096366 [Homalodisca vitripennis]|nr:hypothetical protein J6590_096366 [Homalodisca vitripennis]
MEITLQDLVFCRYDKSYFFKLSKAQIHELKCLTKLRGYPRWTEKPTEKRPPSIEPHALEDDATTSQPTPTIGTYDDRQDRKRHYSKSPPPRNETDTAGWKFFEEPVVRHGDRFHQYNESPPRTCKRVRFSQGILKNSHSSEPHEGYDDIGIRTLDSLLSTVSNGSSNRVLFVNALVEHDPCYGFAAASSNYWCEGVGVPYDLERKRWVFVVDSRRTRPWKDS